MAKKISPDKTKITNDDDSGTLSLAEEGKQSQHNENTAL